MRYVQYILLVIGAAALGAAAGALGLTYLAVLTILRHRPGADPSLEWGQAIGAMCCVGVGGIGGAISGLVVAVRRIACRESKPWKPMVWIGMVLGLAAALAIRFPGVLGRQNIFTFLIEWWPGTVIFTAASGTLGGFVGGIAGALGRRHGTRS